MVESTKKSKEKISENTPGNLDKSNADNQSKNARRQKKRQNKLPPDYDQWDDETKQYYQDVTIALRQWKATQIQCQLRRFTMGFWKYLKYQLRGHPMHADEMKDYKDALEIFATFKENHQLDYD